jgi:methyl-accepting chemotaxis protein
MGFLIIVFVMTIVSIIIICQQAKMQTAFEDSILTCELDRYVLECRRQEKNYIFRNDDEALVLHQANYDTLYAMTKNLIDKVSNDKLVNTLLSMQNKLENYKLSFEEVVQYRKDESSQRQFKISLQQCIASARECQAVIGDIRNMTKDRFDTALSISSIVNTFSVIVGIFLSVCISGFIADKIMDLIDSPEGKAIKYFSKSK